MTCFKSHHLLSLTTSLDVFSPSSSFLCFPIVSNVAVRIVRVVCQVSSCLEHTVLAHACASSLNTGPHLGAHVAVAPGCFPCCSMAGLFFHAVSSSTLALVIWSVLLQRFSEVFHAAALVNFGVSGKPRLCGVSVWSWRVAGSPSCKRLTPPRYHEA